MSDVITILKNYTFESFNPIWQITMHENIGISVECYKLLLLLMQLHELERPKDRNVEIDLMQLDAIPDNIADQKREREIKEGKQEEIKKYKEGLKPFEAIGDIKRITIKDMAAWEKVSEINVILRIITECIARIPKIDGRVDNTMIKEKYRAYLDNNELKPRSSGIAYLNEAISHSIYQLAKEIITEMRNNEQYITPDIVSMIDASKDHLYLALSGRFLPKLIETQINILGSGDFYKRTQVAGRNTVINRAEAIWKDLLPHLNRLRDSNRFINFAETVPPMKYVSAEGTSSLVCYDFVAKVEILVKVCDIITEYKSKYIPRFAREDLMKLATAFGVKEPAILAREAQSMISDYSADNSDVIRYLLRRQFITDREIVDLYETITRMMDTLSTPKHVISIDASSMVNEPVNERNSATAIYIRNVIKFCDFARQRLNDALSELRRNVNIDSLSIIYQDVRIKTGLSQFMPISSIVPHPFQVQYIKELVSYMRNDSMYRDKIKNFVMRNYLESLNNSRQPGTPPISGLKHIANLVIDPETRKECEEFHYKLLDVSNMDKLEMLVLGSHGNDDKIAQKYGLGEVSKEMFQLIREHLGKGHTSDTTRILPLEGITGGGKTYAAIMASQLPAKINERLNRKYIFAYITENKQNRDKFHQSTGALRFDIDHTDKKSPWSDTDSTILVMDAISAIAFVRDKRYIESTSRITGKYEVIFFVDEPTEGCSKYIAENTGISLKQFSGITVFLAICKARLITLASATMPTDHSYRVIKALMGDKSAYLALNGDRTNRARNIVLYQNGTLSDRIVHIACTITDPEEHILLPWDGIDNYIDFIEITRRIIKNPLFRRFVSPSTQQIVSGLHASGESPMKYLLDHRNYGNATADFSTAYAARLAYYHETLRRYVNTDLRPLESGTCEEICDYRKSRALPVKSDIRNPTSSLSALPLSPVVSTTTESYVRRKIIKNISDLEQTVMLYVCSTGNTGINTIMSNMCPSLGYNRHFINHADSEDVRLVYNAHVDKMGIDTLFALRGLPPTIFINTKPCPSQVFNDEHALTMPINIEPIIYDRYGYYNKRDNVDGVPAYAYELYFRRMLSLPHTYYSIDQDEVLRKPDSEMYRNNVRIYTCVQKREVYRGKIEGLLGCIKNFLRDAKNKDENPNRFYCRYIIRERAVKNELDDILGIENDDLVQAEKAKEIRFISPCLNFSAHHPEGTTYIAEIIKCINFPMAFGVFAEEAEVLHKYSYKIFKRSQINAVSAIDGNNVVPLLFGMYKYTSDIDKIRSALSDAEIVLHTIFAPASVMTGTDMVAEEVVISESVANSVSELDIIQGSGRSGRKGRSSKATLVVSSFTFTRLQCYMLYGQEVMGDFYFLFDNTNPVIEGVHSNIYKKFEKYSDAVEIFRKIASTNEIYNLKRIMRLLEDKRSLNALDVYTFPETVSNNPQAEVSGSYDWLNKYISMFNSYLRDYDLVATLLELINKLNSDLQASIDRNRRIRENNIRKEGNAVRAADHKEILSREDLLASLYQLINCIFAIIDHKLIIHKKDDADDYDKNYSYYSLIKKMRKLLKDIERELDSSRSNADTIGILDKMHGTRDYNPKTNLYREITGLIMGNVEPSLIFFAIRCGIDVDEVFTFFESQINLSDKLVEALYLASLKDHTRCKLGVIAYYILVDKPLAPMHNYRPKRDELAKSINFYYTSSRQELTEEMIAVAMSSESFTITIENRTVAVKSGTAKLYYARRAACELLDI